MVTEADINAGYSKRQAGEGEKVVSKLTQEAVRHSHVTRRTGVVEERRAIHERYPGGQREGNGTGCAPCDGVIVDI